MDDDSGFRDRCLHQSRWCAVDHDRPTRGLRPYPERSSPYLQVFRERAAGTSGLMSPPIEFLLDPGSYLDLPRGKLLDIAALKPPPDVSSSSLSGLTADGTQERCDTFGRKYRRPRNLGSPLCSSGSLGLLVLRIHYYAYNPQAQLQSGPCSTMSATPLPS